MYNLAKFFNIKGIVIMYTLEKSFKNLQGGGGQNSTTPSTPAGIRLKEIGFQIYYDTL